MANLLPAKKIAGALYDLAKLVPKLLKFIDKVKDARKKVDELAERARRKKTNGICPVLAPSSLRKSDNTGTQVRGAVAGKAAAGADDCFEEFGNQMPGTLDAELRLAERLGVRVAKPGAQAFDAAISGGTVKWAVLQNGDVVVLPKFVKGKEISHSVLSGGSPVRAAGEADIAGSSSSGYFGLDINNHSGHFRPSSGSLDVGKKAFERAGIKF